MKSNLSKARQLKWQSASLNLGLFAPLSLKAFPRMGGHGRAAWAPFSHSGLGSHGAGPGKGDAR